MTAAPPDIVWQPNPPLPGYGVSSQALFLACPFQEALLEGGRGSGKTAALLIDFAQEVGKGLGPYWRGVLFRETYQQLKDVVLKSHLLFRQAFPEAVWNASDYHWTWPDGECLLFRYIRTEEDYWNYHGWEIPWLGFEELCNWATLGCYDKMITCNRSSHPEVAKRKRVRSTTNPWGKGHAAVKGRFVSPAEAGTPIKDPKSGRVRVRIYAPVEENVALLDADPDYVSNTLDGIEDEGLQKAWRGGPNRWDIAAGAFFADVWRKEKHVVEPFQVPASWRVTRAFDWGSAKPFSVGWYAESDGTEATLRGGAKKSWPRGTIFRIAEWYGWNGKPNEGLRMTAKEIGREIVAREKAMEGTLLAPGLRVDPGPADSSIFDTENGVCIADDFNAVGVRWEKADKRPGSRKNGWEQCRTRLTASMQFPMEDPGFFVFNTCPQFVRLVPVAPRSEKNPDDIDTDFEDHVLDEWRYELSAPSYDFQEVEMEA
jgi:hypothetical protein